MKILGLIPSLVLDARLRLSIPAASPSSNRRNGWRDRYHHARNLWRHAKPTEHDLRYRLGPLYHLECAPLHRLVNGLQCKSWRRASHVLRAHLCDASHLQLGIVMVRQVDLECHLLVLPTMTRRHNREPHPPVLAVRGPMLKLRRMYPFLPAQDPRPYPLPLILVVPRLLVVAAFSETLPRVETTRVADAAAHMEHRLFVVVAEEVRPHRLTDASKTTLQDPLPGLVTPFRKLHHFVQEVHLRRAAHIPAAHVLHQTVQPFHRAPKLM